ncbi:MAG: RNA polymerase sigma factor [Acidimicrobiales bacterium]
MKRDAEEGLSDESLLAGLSVGDEDAGVQFVRRHHRRVYGLALGILGEHGLAEDVAQEAFVRAWRHAQAFDPRRGTVPAWLLTITRNLAIDVLRVQRSQPVDPEALAALEHGILGRPASRTTPEDLVLLRQALAELPEAQRRAVLLGSFLGYTAREISQSEGIPVGTAKTRLRSGMLKLRRALVPDEGVPR